LIKGRIDVKGTAGLLGVVVCWSIGPILIKTLTFHVDAWTQNALRYLVSCAFWLPYLIYAQRTGKITKSVWRKALPVVAANLFMQTCWAAGFYYVSATFHNLMAKSTLIWVPLASVIFFPEERRLFKSPLLWAGMALSVAGVIGIIVASDAFEVKATGLGVIIVTAATIAWAVYTVTIKKYLGDIDARIGFGVVSIYSSIGFAGLMFLFGEPAKCLAMPLDMWTAVVVSSILAIAISHSLYYMTINRIGATIPALTLLSTPFVVAVLARIFLKEALTSTQWAWGSVLIAGAACTVMAQSVLRKNSPS